MAMIIMICSSHKRGKHFVRQQRSSARQSKQVAIDFNQAGFAKPFEIDAVLSPQINSERFTILPEVDASHQTHAEKQRLRADFALAQLLFFNNRRKALLDRFDVTDDVAVIGPASSVAVVGMGRTAKPKIRRSGPIFGVVS